MITRPDPIVGTVAVLSEDSERENRYATYCRSHDDIISIWGQSGARFRRILPPLATAFPLVGYFFWAENDRLAGFRKMQVHGSLFSSFDAIIEHLRFDDEALLMTMSINFAEMAPGIGWPDSLPRTLETFRGLFDVSYEDYLLCKDALRHCADDLAANGKTKDLCSHFDLLSQRYSMIVDNRAAKAVMVLAAVFWKRLGGSDPIDRYYFREHAPIVDRLNGDMLLTHELALGYLNARLAKLGGRMEAGCG